MHTNNFIGAIVPKSVDNTDFDLTPSVGYSMIVAAIAAVGYFGGWYRVAAVARQHVIAAK